MPTLKISQQNKRLLINYGKRMHTLQNEKITDNEAIKRTLESVFRDLENTLSPRQYISPSEDTGR